MWWRQNTAAFSRVMCFLFHSYGYLKTNQPTNTKTAKETGVLSHPVSNWFSKQNLQKFNSKKTQTKYNKIFRLALWCNIHVHTYTNINIYSKHEVCFSPPVPFFSSQRFSLLINQELTSIFLLPFALELNLHICLKFLSASTLSSSFQEALLLMEWLPTFKEVTYFVCRCPLYCLLGLHFAYSDLLWSICPLVKI